MIIRLKNIIKATLSALLLSLFLSVQCFCQTKINAYAKVSGISGQDISLSDTDLTYGTLRVGENILIMQMQEDVIGSNTGNDSNFGTVSTISSVGLYEEATITAINSGSIQTFTVWNEDFEDLSDGDVVDTGETSWSRSCTGGGSSCYTGGRSLGVENSNAINGNLSFAGVDLDQEAEWISEVIDISDFTDITISVNLAEVNFNGPSDYVRVFYALDGGAEQELSYTTTPADDFNNATAFTGSPLNGSDLQIVVRMRDSRTSEYGIIDDILIQGDKYVPDNITLQSPLTNTYNTGINSSVQIISFPRFLSYSTSGDLTALPWDGNIGGVFAIDVSDTLTLDHHISVDGLGFQGGAANQTGYGGGCDSDTYRTSDDRYAQKGEGIYRAISSAYQLARGKIANGGGGGNDHNSGGGGGGNFTQGGDGGPGYNASNGSCNPSAGGLGGEDLSNFISASRVFMGGGGGGGQQNNNAGSSGSNGGGIIIIRASTVVTNSGCGGVSVTANGENAQSSGRDGSGGGGAGGAILFQVSNWGLDCQLTTGSGGGDGGSVDHPGTHGGGGGGGKGVTIFSTSIPATNYVSDNAEGSGGLNGTGAGAGSAGNGSATPLNPMYQGLTPDGVIPSVDGPLPIILSYWKGEAQLRHNVLTWGTESETNNHFFTIEKSTDALHWDVAAIVEGSGNTKERHNYRYEDPNAGDRYTYYRLSQTDYDGTTEVFDVILVKSLISEINLLLYPNPSEGQFRVDFSSRVNPEGIEIKAFDLKGEMVDLRYEWSGDHYEFDLSHNPKGTYLMIINDGVHVHKIRVVIQ